MSLVEAAIRRRADAVGRWMPSSLPADVSRWMPFLLQREWRSEVELCTVAAGLNRSFFVDATGALLACGKERAAEVGLPGLREGTGQTSFAAVLPTPVPPMTDVRVRAVVSSDDCNLAVSEAGQLFAWGYAWPGRETGWSEWHAPEPTLVSALQNHRMCQVAAGTYHCEVLTEDGALFTRETAANPESDEPIPELGFGRFVPPTPGPHRVFALEGARVVAVAVGNHFTVAVPEAGAVYSFGINDGRLGHGEVGGDENVFLPKRIEALDGIPVASVAAGDDHALALTRCGRVYSWRGDGDDSPELGRGNDSDDGDDGDGTDDDPFIPQVITALLGERVRAIAAGPGKSCAVTDAGGLYTWGLNVDWNLGHGDDYRRERPELVTALQVICVVRVSFSHMHSLALAADGSVYSFGRGPGLGIRLGSEVDDEATTLYSPSRIPDMVVMVPR
jgi:alpha-tubulin suppressor-like RCC1 family protein